MAILENFGFVLASKKLMEPGSRVGYMYHEDGDAPDDSGWRFFVGDETDEYVNNPDNISVYDIRSILEIDNSILDVIGTAKNGQWEKTEDGAFAKIEPAIDEMDWEL